LTSPVFAEACKDFEKGMGMQSTEAEFKDPICGVQVSGSSNLYAELDGKTYYFCSDHCLQEFLSTPPGANSNETSGVSRERKTPLD
jgi:YHS domain-containing protein